MWFWAFMICFVVGDIISSPQLRKKLTRWFKGNVEMPPLVLPKQADILVKAKSMESGETPHGIPVDEGWLQKQLADNPDLQQVNKG